MGLADAVTVAGAAGRVNPVVFHFNWNDRYNFWSGLVGGMFLALAYFGCDQSQVQRYLTGKSIAQSRLSLLFNGVAKIPMQFFILLIGVVVFAFYTFEKPPILFKSNDLQRIQTSAAEYAPIAQRYDAAFERRKGAARQVVAARRQGDRQAEAQSAAAYRQAQRDLEDARGAAIRLAAKPGPGNDSNNAFLTFVNHYFPAGLASKITGVGFNDTNYVFLSFVIRYLPAGVVGLMLAMIFGAAMVSISSEMNSLATVTIIDLYQRHVRRQASDGHYLAAARVATLFWGAYAVVAAGLAKNLGSLIETVNLVGSLFYGGLLGVFVLAFFFKRVAGNAAFAGVIAGEAAIFAAAIFTNISFLWYNVIGCVVVVSTALVLSPIESNQGARRQS
jgi:Na+/proline symporter